MSNNPISFDSMPSMLSQLLAKVEGIERRLAAASAPAPTPPDYVTLKEAQEILRHTVTVGTIYNWKCQGRIASTKVGRKLLFKRSDIEAMLRDAASPAEQDLATGVEEAPVIQIRTHQKRKG